MLSLVEVGKEWAGPVFLHPDNHLHKVNALSCQNAERLGRPSFAQSFPTPEKAKFVCVFMTG